MMQVGLDVCTYSQRLMSYLDDSHFPGSQRVLRTGGVIYKLFALHVSSETRLSSTIERNGIMNTMTACGGGAFVSSTVSFLFLSFFFLFLFRFVFFALVFSLIVFFRFSIS